MSLDFDPTRRVRRDPGPNNSAFFGFGRGEKPGADPIIVPEFALLPNRPGHAERDLTLARRGEEVEVATSGWHRDVVTLNDRQARFLRDRLNEWLGD